MKEKKELKSDPNMREKYHKLYRYFTCLNRKDGSNEVFVDKERNHTIYLHKGYFSEEDIYQLLIREKKQQHNAILFTDFMSRKANVF